MTLAVADCSCRRKARRCYCQLVTQTECLFHEPDSPTVLKAGACALTSGVNVACGSRGVCSGQASHPRRCCADDVVRLPDNFSTFEQIFAVGYGAPVSMAVSDQAAGRRRARRGEPIPTAMAKPEPDELDISDTAALPDAGSFSDAPVTKRARAMGVGESPPAHGTAPAGDSNAFEAERAARIAANAARLAELELPGLAAGLAASAPIKRARPAAPSQRGVSARRRSAAADAPPRRSARAAGQAPDAATSGGVLLELRGGRVLLAPPTGSGGGGARAAAAREQQPQQEPPPPPGPLPFTSSNGDAESDEVLLKQLRAQADAAASCEEGRLPTVATGKALLGLSLASSNIAKLTRGPTTQLVVHPSSQRTLIAAADKAGQVRHYLQRCCMHTSVWRTLRICVFLCRATPPLAFSHELISSSAHELLSPRTGHTWLQQSRCPCHLWQLTPCSCTNGISRCSYSTAPCVPSDPLLHPQPSHTTP